MAEVTPTMVTKTTLDKAILELVRVKDAAVLAAKIAAIWMMPIETLSVTPVELFVICVIDPTVSSRRYGTALAPIRIELAVELTNAVVPPPIVTE